MRHDDDAVSQDVTPTIKRWVGLVGVGLLVWFFYSWLILDNHMVDAAGESVGTALAIGVVVSLIGAMRGSR
jgi:hypothetical protein